MDVPRLHGFNTQPARRSWSFSSTASNGSTASTLPTEASSQSINRPGHVKNLHFTGSISRHEQSDSFVSYASSSIDGDEDNESQDARAASPPSSPSEDSASMNEVDDDDDDDEAPTPQLAATGITTIQSAKDIDIVKNQGHREWRAPPCLQCRLKNMPCDWSMPSCSRCVRQGHGGQCLQQRATFKGETDWMDSRTPTYTLLRLWEDEVTWQDKLRLERQVRI